MTGRGKQAGQRRDLAGVGIQALTTPGMQCAARKSTLNKVQERVLEHITHHPGARWRDVAARYGYTAGTVLAALGQLKQRELVEDHGEGRMHAREDRR